VNTFGTTLHSSTDEDLLCVPGICLGFHPTESCVVLGISENHVEFCARADLGWLDEGGAALVEQVEAAARTLESSSFVVCGYTENPGEHSERLVRFASEIKGKVTDVLVAASDRYWIATPSGLTPPEGFAWDPAATALSAEAAYLGIQVARNRAEVIAEVRPSGEPAEVEFLTESALEYVAELSQRQRKELLEKLLTGGDPLLPVEGAQLAVLVGDPGLAGDVVARLDRNSAAKLRPRIAYARRMCSEAQASEVLAMLSLICWYDNQGAQQTECLEQLEKLAPQHRLLPLLQGLRALAIKPSVPFPPF